MSDNFDVILLSKGIVREIFEGETLNRSFLTTLHQSFSKTILNFKDPENHFLEELLSIYGFNPFYAEATFIHGTRVQKCLKTNLTLSYWYSL